MLVVHVYIIYKGTHAREIRNFVTLHLRTLYINLQNNKKFIKLATF